MEIWKMIFRKNIQFCIEFWIKDLPCIFVPSEKKRVMTILLKDIMIQIKVDFNPDVKTIKSHLEERYGDKIMFVQVR